MLPVHQGPRTDAEGPCRAFKRETEVPPALPQRHAERLNFGLVRRPRHGTLSVGSSGSLAREKCLDAPPMVEEVWPSSRLPPPHGRGINTEHRRRPGKIQTPPTPRRLELLRQGFRLGPRIGPEEFDDLRVPLHMRRASSLPVSECAFGNLNRHCGSYPGDLQFPPPQPEQSRQMASRGHICIRPRSP